MSDLDEFLHRLRTHRIDWDKFRPEIELALNTFIWYCSVYQKHSTLGQALLRLRLAQSSDRQPLSTHKSIAYLLIDVVCPWLMHRMAHRSARSGSLERLQRLYKLADLINFLIFLRKGMYLKLWHRMLGIGVCMSQSDMFMHHNFEFMNEQLLFFAASEFMSSVAPLFNMPLIRNSLRIQWNRLVRPNTATNTCSSADGFRSQSIDSHQPCAICRLVPFNPHHIGCRHLFCYYCLRHALEQDRYNGFTCFDCERNIRHERDIQQYRLSCF